MHSWRSVSSHAARAPVMADWANVERQARGEGVVEKQREREREQTLLLEMFTLYIYSGFIYFPFCLKKHGVQRKRVSRPMVSAVKKYKHYLIHFTLPVDLVTRPRCQTAAWSQLWCGRRGSTLSGWHQRPSAYEESVAQTRSRSPWPAGCGWWGMSDATH